MKKMVKLFGVITIITVIGILFASCGKKGGPGTVGGDDDTTPPTVVSVTPANNSTNVPTAGNVVITFSEAMDDTSGTVKLDASPYTGTWNAGFTVYTVPYENLGPGVNVTITISGFKDEAGNVMTSAFTSSFTTAGGVSANAKAGLYDKDTIGDSDEPLVAFDKNNAATTFNAAITKALTDGDSYTLVLDGNVSVSATSSLATVARLRIIGKGSNITITRTGTGSLFTVGLNATLVLQNITLQGNTTNNAALVTVNANTAYLYMYNGAVIKGNTNTDYSTTPGGGVNVTSGYFIMQGGEISGNEANGGGSGVYVKGNLPAASYAGGNFTMSGGEIKDNTNSAVMVEGGKFTMNGGKISGNTADYNAGVSVTSSGTFIMEDGEISGNTADHSGGGVSVSDSGTFTMKDGEIKNNIANGAAEDLGGGGVYVMDEGKFTMEGGKISGNKAPNGNGGGVFVDEDGTFIMKDGEISGNEARLLDDDGWGGGVYVFNGKFKMEGGKILSNNKAFAGGGVFINLDSIFEMSGGEISSNTATSKGGGVFVYGEFTMKNGKISGNTASDYGGGVFILGLSFTMEGGEIYGNTATNNGGGGVYMESRGEFNMLGGEIYGNTAEHGGGVCLTLGDFQMAGGTIYGSNADASKKNKTSPVATGKGAALSINSEANAKYGKYNGTSFTDLTDFPAGPNYEYTVKVVNGALTYQ